MTNKEFRFLSLGNNLLSQKAWWFILDFMRNEIIRALQNQLVDFPELEDTATIHICKGCSEHANDGDLVFHVHLAVSQLSGHRYHELYDALEVPLVLIGGTRMNFCRIITETYKPQIDLLVKKEIASNYANWNVGINPTSFKCSYSLPLYLHIKSRCYNKRFFDVDFIDLSQAIADGKYRYFCDFKKRILKPIKEDFAKTLSLEENAYTFNFETKRLGKNTIITLKLCNNKPAEQGRKENQAKSNKIQNSHQRKSHTEEDRQIQDALIHIKELSWPEFETEVSRLLLQLGYGQGITNAVKVTQRTRDGGIDGYIKCDDLGIERIFFQAKKWDETPVSV